VDRKKIIYKKGKEKNLVGRRQYEVDMATGGSGTDFIIKVLLYFLVILFMFFFFSSMSTMNMSE